MSRHIENPKIWRNLQHGSSHLLQTLQSGRIPVTNASSATHGPICNRSLIFNRHCHLLRTLPTSPPRRLIPIRFARIGISARPVKSIFVSITLVGHHICVFSWSPNLSTTLLRRCNCQPAANSSSVTFTCVLLVSIINIVPNELEQRPTPNPLLYTSSSMPCDCLFFKHSCPRYTPATSFLCSLIHWVCVF